MIRPSRRLDELHLVLLDILTGQGKAMSTAQLRIQANDHPRLAGPVVHEAVYNALQRLRRSGDVDHHRSAGRHTLWTLTDRGAAGQ
jgi:Fe2+ or Zn2+ uptake regulation protein